MNLIARIHAMFRRSQFDRDMTAEMRAHLDAQTARNVAAGMSAENARAAAHRQFGGVAQIQERARDVLLARWIDALARDFHFALRSLRKQPGFTWTAIAMLALGIGLSTSCFSVTNFLFLRPTPFPGGERLMRIHVAKDDATMLPHTPADYFDLKTAATSFSSISAVVYETANVSTPGETPIAGTGLNVTAEFLATTGLQPILGRGFAPDEDQPGKGNVVMLPHRIWTARFGADPEIIGRTIRIGTNDVSVIGVLPPAFDQAIVWAGTDFLKPAILGKGGTNTDRKNKFVHVVCRLKPGVTRREAQAELDVIAARLAAEHLATNDRQRLRLTGLHASNFDRTARASNLLITGLAALVLVIVCANLAGLQLARAFARNHERMTRVALGARRLDLMMPAIVESVLLTAAGAGFGLLIAWWLNTGIGRSFSSPTFHAHIGLGGPVLVFAVVACVLMVFTFGLTPAWFITRRMAGGLSATPSRTATTSRPHHRVKQFLVMAQFALAVVLVGATISFAVAIKSALDRNLGWHPGELTMTAARLPYGRYIKDDTKREFLHAAGQKLSEVPGVTKAIFCTMLPEYSFIPVSLSGGAASSSPEHLTTAMMNTVECGYFSALRIRFMEGQDFPANVQAVGPQLVIVNEALAQALWPDRSSIGQQLRVADSNTELEIVGVVGDVRMAVNFEESSTAFQIYRPLVQVPFHSMTVVIDTPLRPESLDPAVRRAIAQIDPDVVVVQATTSIARHLAGFLEANDLVLRLLAAFAFVGAGVAVVGLYGVITQLTLQRTREIGIRIAIGAAPSAVVRLILGQGARLVLVGVTLGLFGTFGIQRFYRSLWPALEFPAADLHFAISIVLLFTGLAACWLPARRAAKVDPVIALRTE
jgi:putative ABC transport system permease protein